MTTFSYKAAEIIKARIGDVVPKVGLVSGSGLSSLADSIKNPVTISYSELPDFTSCGVEGHPGQLVVGYLNNIPVAFLQGRVHFYEGVNTSVIKTMVRTLKLLGCEYYVATNAVGCLRKDVDLGGLMLITDHINFQGISPLSGDNDDEFGERFFSLDEAYDKSLRAKLAKAALEEKIKLAEGVYIGVLGPHFETPAEIRAFRTWGADAVGMSTVPEVIVANHCGLRVAAVSVVVNYAAGMSDEPLSHAQTLHYAERGAQDLMRLIERLMMDLNE